MKKDWWKEAVVYQVYPRSFYDTNHDGIGDLKGILEKLPYLHTLGINVIWLCPIYASPNDDNGYDISDYEAIMEEFGTMADMDALIETARSYNISIIMDLVVNHTSDEHHWFQEAKKGKDNPYRDYYIWRDPVHGKEPNHLKSDFGGSAWEYDEKSQQYYLHLFSKKQPDLNWDNPKLREEVYTMMKFWINKGIAGFRMDMIELIGKVVDEEIKANGPMLHTYIQEMNEKVLKGKHLLTVGEAWKATIDQAKCYSNPDGSELSMIFQFEHMKLDKVPGTQKWDQIPLSIDKLKKTMSKWQTSLDDCGWNSLFWNNHDLPRIVSRWGDDNNYRVESAKLFAILLHGMKGTPYIYQGEEIGMTNVAFDRIDEYRDIETLNMYQERRENGYAHEHVMNSIYNMSRDNARTPMQWNTEPHGGFSDVKPWIQVNPNYLQINVEQSLQDQESIFYTYQRLIQLRKTIPCLVQGTYSLLDSEENVFAYERVLGKEHILVVCNMQKKVAKWQYPLPENAQVLLQNYKNVEATLQPYEARMYHWIEA